VTDVTDDLPTVDRDGSGAESPRVSVLIGVLNGADSIVRCVESIANQTLTPHEIVVVDDGSTDASPDVLRRLQDRWPDLIRLRTQENQGVAEALNVASSMSTGEFVAIADHDDVFPAHRLATSVELLRRTGADMVGGQVDGTLGRWLRLSRSRFPTEAHEIAHRIELGFDPLPHITMMVRRDGFDRFGGYRPVRRAADLELMLRWAHRGALIAVSPEVLASYTLRWEHLSVDTQTRWMVSTGYARHVARLGDDEVPDFADWFAGEPVRPARREARRRVVRLTARLVLGTLPPHR
jgi:glycosyltransferase involved in cell wall biosynthesis